MVKRKAINYLLEEYDVNNNLLASYSFPVDIWTINGGLINVFCQSKEVKTGINVFYMPFMMTILYLLLKREDKMETGYFDDNGKSIYVGDRLKSEWGYEVIVEMIDGEYVGKLVCNENHICKDIPYSLNKGKGYYKVG